MAKTKPAADSRQCRPGDNTYVCVRNGSDGLDRLELYFGPFSYVSVVGNAITVPDRSLSPGWILARFEPRKPDGKDLEPWVLGAMTKKHAGARVLAFQIFRGEPPSYAKISPVNWNV